MDTPARSSARTIIVFNGFPTEGKRLTSISRSAMLAFGSPVQCLLSYTVFARYVVDPEFCCGRTTYLIGVVLGFRSPFGPSGRTEKSTKGESHAVWDH